MESGSDTFWGWVTKAVGAFLLVEILKAAFKPETKEES